MANGTAKGDGADEGSSKMLKVVQIHQQISSLELIPSSHSVYPLPKPLPPNEGGLAASKAKKSTGRQHRRIRNETQPKGHMDCNLQQRGGHLCLPFTEDKYDLAVHPSLSKLVTLSSGGTEKIRVFEISTDRKTQKEFTCSESEIAVRPRRNSRKFGLSDSSKCDDSHNRLVGIDMDSSSDNRDRKSELLNISLTY